MESFTSLRRPLAYVAGAVSATGYTSLASVEEDVIISRGTYASNAIDVLDIIERAMCAEDPPKRGNAKTSLRVSIGLLKRLEPFIGPDAISKIVDIDVRNDWARGALDIGMPRDKTRRKEWRRVADAAVHMLLGDQCVEAQSWSVQDTAEFYAGFLSRKPFTKSGMTIPASVPNAHGLASAMKTAFGCGRVGQLHGFQVLLSATQMARITRALEPFMDAKTPAWARGRILASPECYEPAVLDMIAGFLPSYPVVSIALSTPYPTAMFVQKPVKQSSKYSPQFAEEMQECLSKFASTGRCVGARMRVSYFAEKYGLTKNDVLRFNDAHMPDAVRLKIIERAGLKDVDEIDASVTHGLFSKKHILRVVVAHIPRNVRDFLDDQFLVQRASMHQAFRTALRHFPELNLTMDQVVHVAPKGTRFRS